MSTESGSSLNRKLMIGAIIMLTFLLLLSASLIAIFTERLGRADQNLRGLGLFRQILVATDALSIERGRVNSVLGDELTPDNSWVGRLADRREKSDAALSGVALDIAAVTQDAVSASKLDNVRERLQATRAAVDKLAALPKSQRMHEDVAAANNAMYAILESVRPVVTTILANAVAQDEVLKGPATMASILAEYRWQAGRFGSLILPSISTRTPLSTVNEEELKLTRATMKILWQLVQQQLGTYGDDPRLVAASNEVREAYFGKGLPFVEAAVAAGRSSGAYTITPEDFVAQYVPSIQSIQHLANAFLDVDIERAEHAHQSAFNLLIIVGLITGLVIVTNVAMILFARHRVFLPLFQVRDQIIALAEGKTAASVASPTRDRDMQRLFEAIETLRVKLGERIAYTYRLKIEADTDALTGLTNRRTFDRIGSGDMEFADLPEDAGLILIDIDHFKRINDTYGHPCGDQILRQMAGIIRNAAAGDGVVSRFGGEELAVIVASADAEEVTELAESIRGVIARTSFRLGDGRKIPVTASFGVSIGSRRAGDWERAVLAADTALYRAKAEGRNRVCVDSEVMSSAGIA